MLLSSDWLPFLPAAADWIHLEHVPPLLSTPASITNSAFLAALPGSSLVSWQGCVHPEIFCFVCRGWGGIQGPGTSSKSHPCQLCLSLTPPWLPSETLLRPHCSQLSPSQPTPPLPLSCTAEVGAEITRLLHHSTFVSFRDNFSLNWSV